MVIGGSVTLGSLWVLSLLTAAAVSTTSVRSELAPLYAPIVGPFITIGTAQSTGAGTAILLLDGIGQSAGLALAITGLALRETYLERNDVGLKVTVAPMMVGAGTLGFGLVGRM
jgi:hypothetical protein